MVVQKAVCPHFEDYIFNWDYEQYLAIGGYGSGKSYNTAFKIVLKCLQETRKVLVVREVFDTIFESCYDLIYEVLDDMNLIYEGNKRSQSSSKVIAIKSPLQFKFPNGSRIIFKGMDKPRKLKSLNNVSIVWVEECSEVKYEGIKELFGRIRHPLLPMHFIFTTNPVGKQSWVYRHFFRYTDADGKEHVRLDENKLYELRVLTKGKVYFHHSVPDDNMFLPKQYIDRLDELQQFDEDLYRIARLGKFGVDGRRVLPQFVVAPSHALVIDAVRDIPLNFRFIGMDFGFEESYNAIVKMAVDDKNSILYIYDEYYKNHQTDDVTADELIAMGYDKLQTVIKADNEDPKAIRYYNRRGIRMVKCKKPTRLYNLRKTKRFKKIVCSPKCLNVIRELSNLTYKKDRDGNLIYDEFNIDPHTLSAIWYGLDSYEIPDPKMKTNNSWSGGATNATRYA